MNGRDIQYINLRKFARQFIEMPIETRLFISAITISNSLSPLISSLLIRRFLLSVPLALRKPLLYPAINNSIVRQYFFLHSWQMRTVIAIGGRLPLLVFAIIMIERWNTLASKASSVYIIFFFFTLILLFGRAREHLDRCQAVAANEWRADCTFNEPVVSGTSHGYHRTDCRHLKLLRPLSPFSKSWQINHNRCESSELIFRVTAPAAGSSNCSRSRALLIANTEIESIDFHLRIWGHT